MTPTAAWQELAQGVFMGVSEPFHVNVGLVVGHERALLIDTGCCLDEGRAIVERARGVTDLPLGAVVSHDHFDHTLGSGALEAELIWGHQLCAERLRWDGEVQKRAVVARLRPTDPQTALQIECSPIVCPGCLVEDEVELDLGERLVRLIHPGRGHTDNDLIAWILDQRVLFSGDLVEEGAPPSFEDSFPLEWPGALDVLLGLDPSQVVPGHGTVVDADFVRRQQSDLEHLADLARKGFQDSLRPAEFDGQTAFPGRPGQTAIRRAYNHLSLGSAGSWVERQPG